MDSGFGLRTMSTRRRRLQPARLPLRHGLAARHRDRGRRPGPRRASARRPRRWPTGCSPPARASTAGCRSCSPATRAATVAAPGALPGGLPPAGLVGRRRGASLVAALLGLSADVPGRPADRRPGVPVPRRRARASTGCGWPARRSRSAPTPPGGCSTSSRTPPSRSSPRWLTGGRGRHDRGTPDLVQGAQVGTHLTLAGRTETSGTRARRDPAVEARRSVSALPKVCPRPVVTAPPHPQPPRRRGDASGSWWRTGYARLELPLGRALLRPRSRTSPEAPPLLGAKPGRRAVTDRNAGHRARRGSCSPRHGTGRSAVDEGHRSRTGGSGSTGWSTHRA